MIKIIGALLILLSGSSIGWIISGIYLNRVRELRELQLAFNVINTEISYEKTILSGALIKAAESLSSSLRDIFLEAARSLTLRIGKGFQEIWEETIEKYKEELSLNMEDLVILKNWGLQIGVSALENQINLNKLIIKRLELQEKGALELASKRVKIARYTGVLISLMLIILFY